MIRKYFSYVFLIILSPLYALNVLLSLFSDIPVISIILGFYYTFQLLSGFRTSNDYILMKILGVIMYFAVIWFVVGIIAVIENVVKIVLLSVTVPFSNLFLLLKKSLNSSTEKKTEQTDTSNINEPDQGISDDKERTQQKQKHIDSNNYDKDYYWKMYEEAKEQEKRKREERERKAREEEERKKAHEEEIIQKEMYLLGVKPGYTKSELRSRRRILAKKYHPDEGGNLEKLKEINDAFDHLYQFAQ